MDKEQVSSPQPIARRTFVTTLVAGFTMATGPLNAAAIVTDSKGLVAGEVKIAVADGSIPGYRAWPGHNPHAPLVLVIQEVFGVHEHIRDLCRRLAKAGYYAIAPSLYARQGDPSKYDMNHLKDLFVDIVSRVPDAEVMTDLDSTVAFARGEGADAGRLAITGFCWGGRIVWLYAAHNHGLKTGAAWYGPLAGKTDPYRPQTAIELAGDVKAPILGLYAGKDQGITPQDIDRMRAALAQSGNSRSRIDVFPDAEHGFNADYRPSYNAADASVAWARMLSWFKANGV
jgi:carboxymethylenebutenolidase